MPAGLLHSWSGSVLGPFQRNVNPGICAAASWSSPLTFVRFYRLDVSAIQVRTQSPSSAGLWVRTWIGEILAISMTA